MNKAARKRRKARMKTKQQLHLESITEGMRPEYRPEPKRKVSINPHPFADISAL